MKKFISYFIFITAVFFYGCGGSSASTKTSTNTIEDISKIEKSSNDIGSISTEAEEKIDQAEHNIQSSQENNSLDGISNIEASKASDELGSPGNPIPAEENSKM